MALFDRHWCELSPLHDATTTTTTTTSDPVYRTESALSPGEEEMGIVSWQEDVSSFMQPKTPAMCVCYQMHQRIFRCTLAMPCPFHCVSQSFLARLSSCLRSLETSASQAQPRLSACHSQQKAPWRCSSDLQQAQFLCHQDRFRHRRPRKSIVSNVITHQEPKERLGGTLTTNGREVLIPESRESLNPIRLLSTTTAANALSRLQ